MSKEATKAKKVKEPEVIKPAGKVDIGININPGAWGTFQKIALVQRQSRSALLCQLIDEHANSDQFKIYNVAPEYGDITKSTFLTFISVSEEQKWVLREWAHNTGCKIITIIRCLIDYTIQNFRGELPPDIAAIEPLYFFQMSDEYKLDIDKIVTDILKEFTKADVQGLLKNYDGDGQNLIDGEFIFTAVQKMYLENIAEINSLPYDSVVLAFILFIREKSKSSSFKNCYVPKVVYDDYKYRSERVFSTVSMMMNSHVRMVAKRKFDILQQKFGDNDDELVRINYNMSWIAKIIFENVAAKNKVKTSEVIRIAMRTSYNTVKDFDVEKIRQDIMQKNNIVSRNIAEQG